MTELIPLQLYEDEVQILVEFYRQRVADLETKVAILEAAAVEALTQGAPSNGMEVS